jgi:hypothetical protein
MKYNVESVRDEKSGRIRIRVELDRQKHKNIWETEGDETKNKIFGAFLNLESFPLKFQEIDITARSKEESIIEEQKAKENVQRTTETAPEMQTVQ